MPSLDEATIQLAIHALSVGAAPFMLFVSLVALYVRISASRTLRKEEQFALRAQQVAPNWLSQDAATYAELVDGILKDAEGELKAKSGFFSRFFDYLFTQKTDWEEFRTHLRPWLENSHGSLTQEDFRSAVRAARRSTRSLTHLLGGIPVESGARFVGALPGILFLLGVFASCLGIAAAIPELVNRLAETPMDIAPLKDFAQTVSWFFGPAALGLALFVGLSGLNLLFPVHSKLRTLGEEIGGLLSFVWNNRSQTHSAPAPRQVASPERESVSSVLEAMTETPNAVSDVEEVSAPASAHDTEEASDSAPEALSSDLLAQLEAVEKTEASSYSQAPADASPESVAGEPVENTWVGETPMDTLSDQDAEVPEKNDAPSNLIVEGDVPEEDKILLSPEAAEAQTIVAHEEPEEAPKEIIVHADPEQTYSDSELKGAPEEPQTEKSEGDDSDWQVNSAAEIPNDMPDQLSYGGIPTSDKTHESEEALEEFPEAQVSGPMRPPEVAFGGIPLGESFVKKVEESDEADHGSPDASEAEEASNAMATLLEKMQQGESEELEENTVTHSGALGNETSGSESDEDIDAEQTNTEIPPPNITAESMQDILDQIEARRAQRPAESSDVDSSDEASHWEEKAGDWNNDEADNGLWGSAEQDAAPEEQTAPAKKGLPSPPAPLWNRPSQASWDSPAKDDEAAENLSNENLSPLDHARTRLKEVESQIQQAYEDKISGKITNALWLQMHTQWAIEKEKLLKEITELEKAA
ncbi:MAG: hypothetical protein R3B54_05290 [Bdellovibrionota bacterium]